MFSIYIKKPLFIDTCIFFLYNSCIELSILKDFFMEENEIITLKCKVCGEPLRLLREGNDGKDTYICDTCGTRTLIERHIDEEFKKNQELYDSIVQLRQKGDFSEVLIRCQEIISDNPSLSFPYMERLYAKYGIQFPEKDEFKATFYIMPTSIADEKKYRFEDEEDYIKAISLASESEKTIYKKIAEDINASVNIYQRIYASTEDYDVFISYKRTTGQTDAEGKEILTDDASDVAELRNVLISQKHLKVFLAPYSIKAGERYEPQIYSSLMKAKVLIVYGSKPEYFSAQWVKNEWSRFLSKVDTNHFKNNEFGYKLNGSLLVVHNNVNPQLLPKELNRLQCISSRQIYADINVIDYIERQLGEYKLYSDSSNKGLTSFKVEKIDAAKLDTVKMQKVSTRELGSQHNQVADVSSQALLRRATSQLKLSDYKAAIQTYSQVLADAPNNGEAIKGRFLAEHKVKNFESFSGKLLYSSIDDIISILENINTAEAEQIIEIVSNNLLTKSNELDDESKKAIFEKVACFDFKGKNSFLGEWEAKAIDDYNYDLYITSLKYRNLENGGAIVTFIKNTISKMTSKKEGAANEFIKKCYFEMINYLPDNLEIIKKCTDYTLDGLKKSDEDSKIVNVLSKICNKDDTSSTSNYIINYLRYCTNEKNCDEFLSHAIKILSKKDFTHRPLILRWMFDNIYVLYSKNYNLRDDIYKMTIESEFNAEYRDVNASLIIRTISLFNQSENADDIKHVLYLSCLGLCHLYDIDPHDIFLTLYRDSSEAKIDKMFENFKSYNVSIGYDDLRKSLIEEGQKILDYPDLLDDIDIQAESKFISYFERNFSVVKNAFDIEERNREIIRNKYNNACDLLERGSLANLTQAKLLFRELGTYKDCQNKLQKCNELIEKLETELKKQKYEKYRKSAERSISYLSMKLFNSTFFAILISIFLGLQLGLFAFIKISNNTNQIFHIIDFALGSFVILTGAFMTDYYRKKSRKVTLAAIGSKKWNYFVYLLATTLFIYISSNLLIDKSLIFGVLALAIINKIINRYNLTTSLACLLVPIGQLILPMFVNDSPLIQSLPFVLVLILSLLDIPYSTNKQEDSDFNLGIAALFISEVINGVFINKSAPLINFVGFDITYFIRFDLLILSMIPSFTINYNEETSYISFTAKAIYYMRNLIQIGIIFVTMTFGLTSTSFAKTLYETYNSEYISLVYVALYIVGVPLITSLIEKICYKVFDTNFNWSNTYIKVFSKILAGLNIVVIVVFLLRSVLLIIGLNSLGLYETFSDGICLSHDFGNINNIIPYIYLAYPIGYLLINIKSTIKLSLAHKKSRYRSMYRSNSSLSSSSVFTAIHASIVGVGLVAQILLLLFTQNYFASFTIAIILVIATTFLSKNKITIIFDVIQYIVFFQIIRSGNSLSLNIVSLFTLLFALIFSIIKSSSRHFMLYSVIGALLVQQILMFMSENMAPWLFTLLNSSSYLMILICAFASWESGYEDKKLYLVPSVFVGEVLCSIIFKNSSFFNFYIFDFAYMLRYDIIIGAIIVFVIQDESNNPFSNVVRYGYIIRNMVQIGLIAFFFLIAKEDSIHPFLQKTLDYFSSMNTSIVWLYLYGFVGIGINIAISQIENEGSEPYEKGLQLTGFILSCVIALIFALKAVGLLFGCGSCGGFETCDGSIAFASCSWSCDCFNGVITMPILSVIIGIIYPGASFFYATGWFD